MFTTLILIAITAAAVGLIAKYFDEIIEWGKKLLENFAYAVKKVVTVALFVAGEIFKTLFYWIDGILYTEKEQPTGHRMSDSEIDKAVSEGILTREEGEKAKTANRGGEKFSKRLAEHTRERYA